MTHFRQSTRSQLPAYKYAYGDKMASGVCMQSTSDYSPFGVLLDGRSMQKMGYRYSFQGQEHDDEVKGDGNSVNYIYRMHDPRVGRFFAVDPLSKDYPWNSTYAFCENRLLDAIELEGLEAWIVTNKWNEEYIKRYGEYINTYAELMNAKDVELSCEDFALSTLISFAKNNNLPLVIRNGNRQYIPDDYKKGEYSKFVSDVLNSSAAQDMLLNTHSIAPENAFNPQKPFQSTKISGLEMIKKSKPGNIVLNDANFDGVYSHVQVVSGKSEKFTFIRQGNFSVGSSDVNSWFYGGMDIQSCTYNNQTGEHINKSMRTSNSNGAENFGIDVREWNFNLFNEYYFGSDKN